MSSYSGALDVTPRNFEARFERLIVRSDRVSFRLEAKEPKDDDWWIEDEAVLRDGVYRSRTVIMHYPSSGERCTAHIDIRIEALSQSVCAVRARLEQYEQEEDDDEQQPIWLLSGNLVPFLSPPDGAA